MKLTRIRIPDNGSRIPVKRIPAGIFYNPPGYPGRLSHVGMGAAAGFCV